MTGMPSPEAMIAICTVILIAYTAHVVNKAFASSEQSEAMLSARERIMGLQAENAKLQELIHDMLPFAKAGIDNTCVTRCCCMFDECTSEVGDKCLIEEHIAARMRELGLDVWREDLGVERD